MVHSFTTEDATLLDFFNLLCDFAEGRCPLLLPWLLLRFSLLAPVCALSGTVACSVGKSKDFLEFVFRVLIADWLSFWGFIAEWLLEWPRLPAARLWTVPRVSFSSWNECLWVLLCTSTFASAKSAGGSRYCEIDEDTSGPVVWYAASLWIDLNSDLPLPYCRNSLFHLFNLWEKYGTSYSCAKWCT